MKRNITILIMLMLTNLLTAIDKDHQSHYFISLGLNLTLSEFGAKKLNMEEPQAVAFGFLGTELIGLGKEYLWDELYQKQKFSGKDQSWNRAGNLSGVLIRCLYYAIFKGENKKFRDNRDKKTDWYHLQKYE